MYVDHVHMSCEPGTYLHVPKDYHVRTCMHVHMPKDYIYGVCGPCMYICHVNHVSGLHIHMMHVDHVHMYLMTEV
jgi:hypothetical protein